MATYRWDSARGGLVSANQEDRRGWFGTIGQREAVQVFSASLDSTPSREIPLAQLRRGMPVILLLTYGPRVGIVQKVQRKPHRIWVRCAEDQYGRPERVFEIVEGEQKRMLVGRRVE